MIFFFFCFLQYILFPFRDWTHQSDCLKSTGDIKINYFISLIRKPYKPFSFILADALKTDLNFLRGIAVHPEGDIIYVLDQLEVLKLEKRNSRIEYLISQYEKSQPERSHLEKLQLEKSQREAFEKNEKRKQEQKKERKAKTQ